MTAGWVPRRCGTAGPADCFSGRISKNKTFKQQTYPTLRGSLSADCLTVILLATASINTLCQVVVSHPAVRCFLPALRNLFILHVEQLCWLLTSSSPRLTVSHPRRETHETAGSVHADLPADKYSDFFFSDEDWVNRLVKLVLTAC